MTLAPSNIRECPACKKPVEQLVLNSGNTFGAVQWSDGFLAAPMLPEFPRLGRCPHCATLFWVPEATLVGDCWPPDIAASQWPGAKTVEGPTAEEFLSAIPLCGGDKEKELFVRLRSWWRSNDRFRKGVADAPPFSETERGNLEELAEALDDAHPHHTVMRAEIARELGQFEQCLALLERDFGEELMYVVGTIRDRALDLDPKVMELK
ncbi:MAG: hypothetical protein IT577_13965 [Verrucomicrobiae bacterium]|nr:hypothetical protein [Verrucomicrobiae bacterium]